jgi:hypothetical protein
MAPDPIESQPSMHATAPSGLDTKMDVLITQVTYLTQLMMVQQSANMECATMHTIIDEDEEMEDFIMDAEEEGVTQNRKVRLSKYIPPQAFDGTRDDTKSLVPWYCTSQGTIQNFVQLNLKLWREYNRGSYFDYVLPRS